MGSIITDTQQFPTVTKKTAAKIAKLIANKLDYELVSGFEKDPLDEKKTYYKFSYSMFNDTPLMNFLPYDVKEKKVKKGSKSVYSFNLITLRPTENSKEKYDIPSTTAKTIKELIWGVPE